MKKPLIPLIVSVVIMSVFMLKAAAPRTYPSTTTTKERYCTSFTVSQPIGSPIVVDANFTVRLVSATATNLLPSESITIQFAALPAGLKTALSNILDRLEVVKDAAEP